MQLTHDSWEIKHLHLHLQEAVNLEFWTIPFYMSIMYSIKDRSSDAYQLIRTVVNQEMLHLQSAANIANAYGLSPTFDAPEYNGEIPYIDLGLDPPEAIAPYLPYSAKIGALDIKHVNAMCLVEIPEYETQEASPHFFSEKLKEEYGSIGAFYAALRVGAEKLKDQIKGGVNQVDFFKPFYNNMPNMTVTESKDNGFNQVDLLIELITDQGEGESKLNPTVLHPFQNTADDEDAGDDHFEKFNQIKNLKKLPETFQAKPRSKYTKEDEELEIILIEQFTELRKALAALFSGENADHFFPLMASVGGAIRNCWAHGVTPKFS